MELSIFIKYLWAPFIGVFWWENRNQRQKIDDLEAQQADLRIHVAENYVSQSNWDKAWGEIREALHRIEDKLDKKADK